MRSSLFSARAKGAGEVAVYVQSLSGQRVDADDLRAWVASRLAKFKVPRDVAVLEALPRNPNGKVVKGALR